MSEEYRNGRVSEPVLQSIYCFEVLARNLVLNSRSQLGQINSNCLPKS